MWEKRLPSSDVLALAIMKYNRPPWPPALYQKFSETAKELGYEKKGTRWKLLERLLEYSKVHSDLFRL